MRPLKEKLSITLDDNIVEKLKSLSEEWDRSVSSCINIILKDYFAHMEDK